MMRFIVQDIVMQCPLSSSSSATCEFLPGVVAWDIAMHFFSLDVVYHICTIGVVSNGSANFGFLPGVGLLSTLL